MRPLRRWAVAVVAGLAVAHPAAATADPRLPLPAPAPERSTSCTIAGPARVARAAPTTTLAFRLGADCPTGVRAVWNLVDPRGATVDRLVFDSGRTRSHRLDARSPLGTYRLRPVGAAAADRGYTPLTQNGARVVVGLRSRTSVAAARSGRTVAVTAGVATYVPAGRAFRPRAGATVTLQRASCAAGCDWAAVATTRTDSRGLARFRARAPRIAHWRTVASGTSSAWGSISAAVVR